MTRKGGEGRPRAAQQAKPWEALFRLSQLLSRSLELTEVYPAFATAVKAFLPYDRIGVVVPEGNQLIMALSVAEPGQILISQGVLGTVEELIEVEPVGELTLKGFHRSVTTHNALRLKS